MLHSAYGVLVSWLLFVMNTGTLGQESKKETLCIKLGFPRPGISDKAYFTLGQRGSIFGPRRPTKVRKKNAPCYVFDGPMGKGLPKIVKFEDSVDAAFGPGKGVSPNGAGLKSELAEWLLTVQSAGGSQ